ncbi:hypothetical protein Tco_1393510 [Tanacetum coccineum]
MPLAGAVQRCQKTQRRTVPVLALFGLAPLQLDIALAIFLTSRLKERIFEKNTQTIPTIPTPPIHTISVAKQGDRDRYTRDYEAYEHFVALCEQEAGGSRSGPYRRRTYIPREREDAEQRLIDDYFGDDEFVPEYPEEIFRRRYRMSSTLFNKIVNNILSYDVDPLPGYFNYFRQRHNFTRRLSIGLILKCTSTIRQLAYDTAPDAFDEYLQIAERTSRECLENFTKCIHVLYVEKFLRKLTAADIQKTYQLHKQKHGLPGRVVIICIGNGETAQRPYMGNSKEGIINTQLLC